MTEEIANIIISKELVPEFLKIMGMEDAICFSCHCMIDKESFGGFIGGPRVICKNLVCLINATEKRSKK